MCRPVYRRRQALGRAAVRTGAGPVCTAARAGTSLVASSCALPSIFFFPRGVSLCGKFFCLPRFSVAKRLAINQFVTNYFATKQFQRRDFNQLQSNIPPQSGLYSQMKRPPLLLSSHAPLLLTQTPPSLQRSSLYLALSSLAQSSSKNETLPSQTFLIPFAFETLTLKFSNLGLLACNRHFLPHETDCIFLEVY